MAAQGAAAMSDRRKPHTWLSSRRNGDETPDANRPRTHLAKFCSGQWSVRIMIVGCKLTDTGPNWVVFNYVRHGIRTYSQCLSDTVVQNTWTDIRADPVLSLSLPSPANMLPCPFSKHCCARLRTSRPMQRDSAQAGACYTYVQF
jgi:hypothetical protein